MRYSRQNILVAYASLLGGLFITTIGHGNTVVHAGLLSSIWQTNIGNSIVFDMDIEPPNSPEYRTARRLQMRLHALGIQTPSIHTIANGVLERQELLKKKLHVTMSSPDQEVLREWDVSLQKYPLWIVGTFNMFDVSFSIDPDRIAKTIAFEVYPNLPLPTNAVVSEIKPGKEVVKVEANVAKSGYELHLSEAVRAVAQGLEANAEHVDISLHAVNGAIVNETKLQMGEMKLLATGKSNFAGSTWNRSFNVRKALREHVNNTLVAPGATFSFNSTLGGPVTQSNGWAMAKIIVNGADLESAPGGGICQASTTTYRAVLHAGLPVTERKSHSLYVSYYKEYGVGIDATIFPGSQDLVFTNDTGNYLLLQAYDDGFDAYVNIYGTPDGRTVELDGPFFAENAPEDLDVYGRKIRKNEIAWLQKVNYPDGKEIENTIVSAYRILPKYVSREYAYAQ